MEAHGNTSGVVVMVIASIIITYYLTMTILLRENKTDNRNKLYQGLLMGLWMGLVQLLMIGVYSGVWVPTYTIILIALVVGIFFLNWVIYEQKGINENQFMLSMTEHHEMGIEMARLAKPKVVDPQLMKIIDNIIESQQREIDEMREILNRNRVPNDIRSLFY